MSLLREIQKSLMKEGSEIGPILLKLRFLASRLGSDLLEEWVKHESEGYPSTIEIPDYRKLSVSYTANFSGPFGSGIKNAPIPSYLIEEHCGKYWNNFEMRQSVAAIDDLLAAGNGSTLQINASNLILLLQGNVYAEMACNSVTGQISKAALAELQYGVRSKILELTIGLEKQIPAAAEVSIGDANSLSSSDQKAVAQVTQQVFHGDYTAVTNWGHGAKISISVSKGDEHSFANALKENGINESDAIELAEIVKSEKPESEKEPWGDEAKKWLAGNLSKAADGTWKAGMSVATKVLTEAALKYYGLK